MYLGGIHYWLFAVTIKKTPTLFILNQVSWAKFVAYSKHRTSLICEVIL